MGYRSDIVLMAVFANAEQHDEVLSVYRMDPRVQEHKCEQDWRRVDMDDGVVVRIFEGGDLKWYDSYEYVQGFEYLSEVMDLFFNQRDFEYAFGKLRIGEEDTDIEHEVTDNSHDGNLAEVLYDNLRLTREITVSI